MRFLVIAVLATALLAGCQRSATMPAEKRTELQKLAETLPAIPREARGAWVATVANIDWPSKPGLPTEQQQAELRAILDRAVALHLNVIVLQVRTVCDAFYPSELEPWSAYLTGKQGQPPEPYYDPLAFAIDEAHARGLELHAWLNPFRAQHPGNKSVADSHVIRTHPEWVRQYGNYQWLDPGVPEARAHSLAVVQDLVQRYDLDGIHVDDYFYPYPERDPRDAKKNLPFPDDASWAAYQASGGTLMRDDWRRDNIHQFMEAMYATTKAAKPHVKVGISPFGIWRPKHPEQIEGFDAYTGLYADSLFWLQQGWCDYFTPQLYWQIDAQKQSYPVLLNWWLTQNTLGRAIWPGNFTSRVGDSERNWPASEIVQQIELTRSADQGVAISAAAQPAHHAAGSGNIHFSMRALQDNRDGLTDRLMTLYATPALVPAMPWLDDAPPAAPRVASEIRGDEIALRIEPLGDEPAWQWAVQVRYGAAWQLWIEPATRTQIELPTRDTAGNLADLIAVRAVDRCGNLSAVAVP